jgi:hypothetical protein
MPTLLPERKPHPRVAPESFGFKVALVASALVLGSFVATMAEIRLSSPGHSLSESEVALKLSQP